MTVSRTNVVDFVGVEDSSQTVVLTIVDDLEWDEAHLEILREKITRYREFINAGELVQKYPRAQGRVVRIEILYDYVPTAEATHMLESLSAILQREGILFTSRPIDRS